MKIIIEILTESQDSIGEAIEMLQGLKNGPQSNGNVPTQPKEGSTNTITASEEKTPSEPAKPAKKPRAKKEVKAETLTLGELKTIAQEAVARSDRQKVKDAIAVYAEKLSEVEVLMYDQLAADLKAL